MDLPISLQDITYAENYLAQGDLATAPPLLERHSTDGQMSFGDLL